MRKVKLQMQVSVDGFVAGPSGEMDWMVWNWDEEIKNYVQLLTEPVDCILLGRKLAQGFIPHWAAAAKDEKADIFTHKMNDTHKIVFSKTLKGADWENTLIADGNIEEEVAALKQKNGSDIIVYGGAEFVSNLIQKGLIDDFYLFVNPVALGQGLPIFQNRTNFKLIESKAFTCGIVVHHYQP